MKRVKDMIAKHIAKWLYKNGYSAIINAEVKGVLSMKSAHRNFYYGTSIDHPVTISNGKSFVFPSSGEFEVNIK